MIDCGVHNSWASAEDLLPYIDPAYRDYLEQGELPGLSGAFPHGHRPWFHPQGTLRRDLTDDHNPGANWHVMKTALLDAYDYDYAILLGEEAIEASTIANPAYATALVAAYNDYLINEWLPLDSRLKGSMVIAPNDPVGAAAEIRRIGSDSNIVQILMSSGSERPYGDRRYAPIWEAANELRLPLAIDLGGHGGINHHPISCGPTTYFWETNALLTQPSMTHIASVLANGCFERWPNVKFIVLGCGIAWIAPLLWRLDTQYRALRQETPSLKQLPSDYAKNSMRFGTQPFDQPADPAHLHAILDAIDGKQTLMYASNYPRREFDTPDQINVPESWHDNLFDKNARDVYRLHD